MTQRIPPDQAAKLNAALAAYNDGSGLSMPQAARLYGLNPNSLKAWRRKALEAATRQQTAEQSAALKLAAEMQAHHKRLIQEWDRRREIAGGVPWDAGG